MEQELRHPAPRPASTVVLLRPTPARFDVLMIKRHDEVAFMGGAHVFPGGSVDTADRDRQPDPIGAVPAGHQAAAVRELAEEAGIELAAGALIPFARWITPSTEPRRYDAWFFVARAPEHQTARHDNHEAVDAAWFDPVDALERCRRGEIALAPPTWTTMETLARFERVDDVLAWARTRKIAPIQPTLVTRDGRKLLTIPGPPETRFAFDQGRWVAVSGSGRPDE